MNKIGILLAGTLAFVVGASISLPFSRQKPAPDPLSRPHTDATASVSHKAPLPVKSSDLLGPAQQQNTATTASQYELSVAATNPELAIWASYLDQQDLAALFWQIQSLSDASVDYLSLELTLLESSRDIQLTFLREALNQGEPNQATQTLMRTLMQQITLDDPVFAYTFFLTLPDEQKNQVANSFIRNYAKQKPVQAWQLLDDYQSSKQDYLGRRGTSSYRGSVLSALAEKPETRQQAFALLFSLDNKRSLSRLSRYLGNYLGQTDVQAALAYQFPFEFEQYQDDFINAAISSYANTDAIASAEKLIEHQELANANSVRMVARNLMRLEDAYHLDDFYNQLDNEDLKDTIEMEASRNWALQKDESAVQDWIIRIDDQRKKYRALRNAINALGYQDYSMQSHLKLIRQAEFTDANMLDRAITVSLSNWNKVEPEQVASYVASMPDNALRGSLLKRFGLGNPQS